MSAEQVEGVGRSALGAGSGGESGAESPDEKPRISHARGMAIANELIAEVFTEEVRGWIAIGGSLRRGLVKVGDVELIMEPKIVPAGTDLFGETTHERNLQLELVQRLLAEGTLKHRPDKNGANCCGRRMQRLLYKGVPVDCFCVIPPTQRGLVMAIRTGSAEFSQKCMTPRSVGGWKPEDVEIREGQVWIGGVSVPCPEEEVFFRLLGIPFRKPEDRYVER